MWDMKKLSIDYVAEGVPEELVAIVTALNSKLVGHRNKSFHMTGENFNVWTQAKLLIKTLFPEGPWVLGMDFRDNDITLLVEDLRLTELFIDIER